MYEYARYGDDWQMIERVSWNEKGQKISEALFSDDEKTVDYCWDWYTNSQLKSHKDDAKENEGWSFTWYENGQMHMRAKYHQGEVVGVITYWHPNGQKSHEIAPRTDEIFKTGLNT